MFTSNTPFPRSWCPLLELSFLIIQILQVLLSELGSLEWDTFYLDCLFRISNVDTGFSKLECPFPCCILISWHAIFQTSRLLIRDSDWLKFIHFSGYKYKIRLIWILWKRENHALISISTILKLSTLFQLKDKNNSERYIYHLGFWIWIEEPKFPFFKFGNYPFITTYKGRKTMWIIRRFLIQEIKIEHGNFSKMRQWIIDLTKLDKFLWLSYSVYTLLWTISLKFTLL